MWNLREAKFGVIIVPEDGVEVLEEWGRKDSEGGGQVGHVDILVITQ